MDEALLIDIGLSKYEARCYLTLVTEGALQGMQVAARSGVPATSVYRVLESLRDKGLIKLVRKNPLTYQAPSPEVVLQNYCDTKKLALQSSVEFTIKELKSLQKVKPKEQKEVLTLFEGKYEAYNEGLRLVSMAKKEIFVIGRGEKPGIFKYGQLLPKAKKRGVDCRFITTSYEENKEVYDELKKQGVAIRKLDINLTLLVLDGKKSVIIIKTPQLEKDRIALFFNDEDYSKANREYYLSLWKKAKPI